MGMFLVNVKYSVSYYMSGSKDYDANHIVIANDSNDADRKVREFYDKKCEEYSVFLHSI